MDKEGSSVLQPACERSITLAHDWLVGLRGGEWVLDRLAQLLGPTRIITLVADHSTRLTDAIARCQIITSPLQNFPGASGKFRRSYLPLMPWAVSQLQVPPSELLISTSSAVIKSLRPPKGTPHLCYCHSPARYIWEQTSHYAHGRGGWWRAPALRLVRKPFQTWDRRAAARVTRFLANSQHTAERIKRCFHRQAHVVYPPVRTEFFIPDPRTPREDWYLVVSALEPYKRVDLVIEAARLVGFPLKIVGDGSQFLALRRHATSSIQLLGRINDQTLRELYRRARALIFPQVEDFGITAVEAQATGCPVIALAAGGALETMTAQTGVHFQKQSVDSLIDAMDAFESRDFDADVCRANAIRFSEPAFDDAMLKHVNELLRGQ